MTDIFDNLITTTEPDQNLGLTGMMFDPIRIGLISDLEIPDSYLGPMYVEPIMLAFDQAVQRGLVSRPLELIVSRHYGLPHHHADNAITGMAWLKEQGCIGVIGPMISDNARGLRDYVNDELRLPCVSWAGTSQWHGEYCLRLGNGGCTEEGQLMASWLRGRGIEAVGVLNEMSPNGKEYFDSFRYAADEMGLRIVGIETITQTPTDLEDRLARLRDSGAEGLAYMGFGWPTTLMAPMFDRLAWDPPRIMTTAFQFCYAFKEWMEALIGWVGIDQVCEDNPLYGRFLDDFEAHYGYRPHNPNTVPVLAYDSARVFTEGLNRARTETFTGPGLLAGLERMRFVPSYTGGPRTPLACGPGDHQMFKGDWLLYRRVAEYTKDDGSVGVRTELDGLYDPTVGLD